MRVAHAWWLPVALLLAVVPRVRVVAAEAGPAIAAAIASTERPEADRAQDERRNPGQLLEFAGVAPGMRVFDAFAAGGYYTELLSRVLGAQGSVIAYNNAAYARFAEKGIAARYAGNRLPNVKQLTVEVEEIDLPPASLDAVLFVMSFHDLYWRRAGGALAPTGGLRGEPGGPR